MDTANRAVIDRFNEAAERRYRAHLASRAGIDNERRKPLGNLIEGPTLLYKFGLMLEVLDLREGMRVLDFATGGGWLARALNYLGVEATGIDVSPTAIGFAEESAARDPFVRSDVPLRFCVYDGFRFPLEDGIFERVACFDAFHHIPNKRRILAEFARVLPAGGKIAFVEPGPHHGESEQARSEAGQHGVLEDSVSVEDLAAMAGTAGFGKCEILPYPPVQRLRFSLADYRAFMRGDDRGYRLGAIRNDLRYAFIASFVKGGPVDLKIDRYKFRLWPLRRASV